jgi:hydroxymethylpyrimidine/phosphomethylpyrimidine kinase
MLLYADGSVKEEIAGSASMRTVLTIAGFDPSSGAGVTADLMVFAAHGLFGTSCITALTVQSTVGVRATEPVRAKLVRETLECLVSDLSPSGVKIGMLGSAEVVEVVADFLEELREGELQVPVVLDPVVRSSSGKELLDALGVEAMRERLLPVADWVTPNLEELAVLTERGVRRREDLVEAAKVLAEMGGGVNVVATGGHLIPPDDLVLVGEDAVWLEGEQIVSRSTHGTGCAFSSALVSRLVLGDEGIDAARHAKGYVAEAIRRAEAMGRGLGPVKHLWPLLE